MILEMVAWRDPNVVPIKAFYGDDLKVNYCGKLATDHHVQVGCAEDLEASLNVYRTVSCVQDLQLLFVLRHMMQASHMVETQFHQS